MKYIFTVLFVLMFAGVAFAGSIYHYGYTNPDNMPNFERLGSGYIYFSICADEGERQGCIEVRKKGNIFFNGRQQGIQLDYIGDMSITEFLRIYNENHKEDREVTK